MSTFQPLNLNNNVKKLDEDEQQQTKELQVEQGFKIFQKALELQKDKKYQESADNYKQLFKLSILKSSETNLIPSVKTLRYLAHKNRAILNLRILRGEEPQPLSQEPDPDISEDLESFSKIVNDLIEALNYCNYNDDDIVNILFDIFQYFNSPRLTRLLLELQYNHNLPDILIFKNISHNRLIENFSKRLENVVSDINNGASHDHRDGKMDCFLQLRNQDIKLKQQNSLEIEILEIQLSSYSWYEVLFQLEKSYDNLSKAKSDDPLFSDKFITTDVIKFVYNESHLPAAVVCDTVPEENKKEPQRISKRVKNLEDVVVSLESFKDIINELKRVDYFITKCSSENTNVLESMIQQYIELLNDEVAVSSTPQMFHALLKDWDKAKSGYLIDESNEKANVISILDIFNSIATKIAKPTVEKSVVLNDLVETVNSGNQNIYELRYFLLTHLLDSSTIIDCKLNHGPEILAILKKYFDYYKVYLNNIYNDIVFKNQRLNVSRYLKLALSFAEILLDTYLSEEKERDKLALRIEESIEKINNVMEISRSNEAGIEKIHWFRFQWIKFLFGEESIKRRSASTSTSTTSSSLAPVTDSINAILGDLNIQNARLNVNITYQNYPNFPPLNQSSIDECLKKYKVLNSFSKILNINSDNLILNIYSDETLNLLNLIFDPNSLNHTIVNLDEKLIYKFIKSSNYLLQLKLWQVLFNHYYSIKDLAKFQSTLDNFILAFLQLPFDSVTFLSCLKYLNGYLSQLLELLAQNSWEFRSIQKSTFTNIVEVLKILHVYYLNRITSGSISDGYNFLSNYPKVTQVFNNLLSNVCSLLYLSWKSLQPEPPLDLLSNIHAILGYASICDCSVFLSLLQDQLLHYNNPEYDLEIYQLLHCKYDLNIVTDFFVPYNHNVSHEGLTYDTAVKLISPVLKIAFDKKDPYFNSNIKNDYKLTLDKFYEIIGNPDPKYEIISRQDSVVETYLNSSLTMHLLQQGFYGLIELNLKPTKLQIQPAILHGLYYAQAVFALTLFKIRKRTMQGRSAELDFVIQMFKSDLICGTNRPESWILLGQTYSYLVEDDLIWTSDKLNSDKKNNIAVLQKKSLLCYLIAISLLSKSTPPNIDPKMVLLVYPLFSKELYNACMKPMDKLSFRLSTTPRVLLTNQGWFETNYEKPISHRSLFKINLLVSKMSQHYNPNDWSNYYRTACLQYKLKYPNKTILNSILTSCKIATPDSEIIEPHYKLLSMVYKLVLKEKLSIQEAVEYIRQDSFNDLTDTTLPTTVDFFSLFIIVLLKRLITADKKKWQHKPRYRIAQIYYLLHKIELSKQEMDKIISLRLNNKNILTIWKPEFERPGKHFVYAFDYITFYMKLLAESCDFSSLVLLIRKLRRFGSGMVNMLKAWEMSCHNACTIIREYLGINSSYTEDIVSKLVYTTFMDETAEYIDHVKQHLAKDLDMKVVLFLQEASEIRRMNNGFGTTAEIDDTFIAIYLKLFLEYRRLQELSGKQMTQPETPNTVVLDWKPKPETKVVKLKVARRDIFPRAVAILKLLAKIIDTELKKDEHLFDGKDKIDSYKYVEGEKEEKVEVKKEEKVEVKKEQAEQEKVVEKVVEKVGASESSQETNSVTTTNNEIEIILEEAWELTANSQENKKESSTPAGLDLENLAEPDSEGKRKIQAEQEPAAKKAKLDA